MGGRSLTAGLDGTGGDDRVRGGDEGGDRARRDDGGHGGDGGHGAPRPDPADRTDADRRDPTRFVLVGASHPGNVGAAARAIKVMGFADLVLVAPLHADVLAHPQALAMASSAADVLAAGRVVATLDEALDGVHCACATAMTPRDFGPPTHAPRDHFATLAAGRGRVAFVFGPERTGLVNDDVRRCHACVSIPTAPDYGSLNLAQAVQLIAYEWRTALGGWPVVARTVDAELADGAAVAALLAHWRDVLEAIGFLDPAAPRKLMARLRRLANRAALTREEVQILRGIARAVDEAVHATADAPHRTARRVRHAATAAPRGDDRRR